MSTLLALRSLSKALKLPATAKYYAKMPPYINASNTMLLRNIATNHTQQQQRPATVGTPTAGDEWRTIYHLPMIRLASAFNRVKIPYGILNAVVIPGAFAMEQATQLPPTTAMFISAVGVTTWMTLAICSYFVKNLVGFVYLNDNNDKLKLAYVDYWGKRCDIVIDLDDLVPESEKLKTSKFDFYQSLTFYSDEKMKYKLLQRFGSIEDREAFIAIFGD